MGAFPDGQQGRPVGRLVAMTSAPPPAPPSSDPPPMEPPAWAPPPPADPAPRTALHRSTGDRMLGGVCGGLAEYSGVDALLWRVGFVALTVAGGTGVIVYALLWLLMPSDAARSPRAGALSAAPRRGTGRAPAGPRSPVGRITVAGLLIVIGILVLLTHVTSWTLGPRGFLGAALLVVGVGLVVTAFTPGRRSRGGLILLGALLSIALAIASGPGRNVHWNVDGGVGSHTYRPLTAQDVHGTYDAGIGTTQLDLTAIDLAGAGTPIRTTVDGGVGKLVVLVPESADVQVNVTDGLGRVDLFGAGSNDGYFRGTGPASWTGDDHPEFVISIDAGIGDVEVSRA
jgi:phage shock protein PspC (stress-responsive transcriptional regulator)